jgi:galactose mutarotase-like enzyme
MEKLKTITITSADGSTQATFVPARGGAACSIIMPGKQGPRELLYLHDFFWDEKIDDLPGGWPFCFPVCARLTRQNKRGAYLYDGKIYEMKIHGFAWYEAWTVEKAGDDYLILVLRDNAHTRQGYPFSFELKLKYKVTRARLTCEQTYHNLSPKPMPYYAGFHPYFLTPPVDAGKEKVRLNYHPTRHLIYNSDLTDIAGEAALFNLPVSVTDTKINEQLTMVGEDKTIELQYPDGDKIHMVAEGVEDPNLFSYIQLYTMAKKPFICVEPWMAFPNAMNSVYGVRWLAPGDSEHGLLTLWLD